MYISILLPYLQTYLRIYLYFNLLILPVLLPTLLQAYLRNLCLTKTHKRTALPAHTCPLPLYPSSLLHLLLCPILRLLLPSLYLPS